MEFRKVDYLPVNAFKHNATPQYTDICLRGDGFYQVDRTIIFVCGTAYGDGEYPVYDKNENPVGHCAVDAGLLSVIPKTFCDRLKFNRYDLVTIIDGGETKTLDRGNFQCGDYEIHTDGKREEEIAEEEEREIERERQEREEEENEE